MNTLLQLEAFKSLCEAKSYTAAAKQLQISQSYLSKLIKGLEESYNIKLVSQVDRTFSLTKAGEQLYESCCFILGEYHRIDHELRMLSISRTERLSVGITHNAIMADFYGLLSSFICGNPDIDVNVIEVPPELFKDYLDAQIIDVAIGWYKNRGSRNYQIYPIISGVWKVCVRKDHPLAGRDSVEWQELRDYDFILSSDDNHRREMTIAIQKHGFTPKVKHYVTFFCNVLELIDRGLGIAPVPSTINLDNFENLEIIRLTPEMPCNFSMATRKGDDSLVLDKFVKDYCSRARR